jgi:hypothetical protein
MQLSMKAIYVLILWAFASNANLYSQNTPTLIDCSFHISPDSSLWLGNTNHFNLVDSTWQLAAQSAGSSTLLYAIPTKADLLQTKVHLGFSPSNANQLQFILASDTAQLDSPWNGYILQLGENGSQDKPRLYAIRNGVKTDLIQSFDVDISSGGELSITIAKSSFDGKWNAQFSVNDDNNYRTASFSFDWEPTNDFHFNYFGYFLQYTRSNTQAFTLKSCGFGYSQPALFNHRNAVEGVELEFTHPLNPASNPQIRIHDLAVHAELSMQNNLHIPWPVNLASGNYNLKIEQIELLGAGLVADTVIRVQKPYIPLKNDIVISEFSAIAAEGLPEFIEFFNTSSHSILLQELAIADQRDTLNLAEIVQRGAKLEANSYLLIGKDLERYFDIPESTTYINAAIPTLNNGGDRIKLLFNNLQVLDELAYNSNWVRTGNSTERKRLDLPSNLELNWELSEITQTISPGFANTVWLDVHPPSLMDFTWVQPDTLYLQFDEPIDTTAELNINVFAAENETLSFQKFDGPTKNTIGLQILSTLAVNTTFELHIYGIQDYFGNLTPILQIPLYIRKTDIPTFGDIQINEFLADATNAQGEFVELINTSNKLIDAQQLSLTDAANARFRFSFFQNELASNFKASTYLAIGNFATTEPITNYYFQPSFLTLNNENEQLKLWYADSILIDEIAWEKLPKNDSQTSIHSFQSMEKIDPFTAGLDKSKWKRTTSFSGHTLGNVNATFENDNTPPVLLNAEVYQDSLRLNFSEFSFPPKHVAVWLDGIHFQEMEIKPLIDKQFNSWIFSLPSDINNKVKVVELVDWFDIKAQTFSVQKAPILHYPKNGDLALNEVFYQPIQNDDDWIEDQFEWLELHNPTDYHVKLNDVFIHQGIIENGYRNRIDLTVEESVLGIPPNGYFVISASNQNQNLYEHGTNTIYIAKRSLSLSNDSSKIYLQSPDFGIIDSIKYQSSWHHPALQVKEGVSLERIHANLNGFSSQNWGSNATKDGHSFNKRNSLSPPYIDTENEILDARSASNSMITIRPQIFSPNGDGIAEVCEIELIASSKSEILNAKVFDRSGLLIKNLSRNKRAAANNLFIWNGRSDSNIPLASGVYILWVEWKDFETNKAFSLKKRLIIAPYH